MAVRRTRLRIYVQGCLTLPKLGGKCWSLGRRWPNCTPYSIFDSSGFKHHGYQADGSCLGRCRSLAIENFANRLSKLKNFLFIIDSGSPWALQAFFAALKHAIQFFDFRFLRMRLDEALIRKLRSAMPYLQEFRLQIAEAEELEMVCQFLTGGSNLRRVFIKIESGMDRKKSPE